MENRITDRVCEVARRLYGMPGCGAVTAAKIMGETAPASPVRPRLRNMPVWPRFRTGPDAPPDGCVDRIR